MYVCMFIISNKLQSCLQLDENSFGIEARHQFRLSHTTNKTYFFVFRYFAKQLAKLYASFEHLSVIPTKHGQALFCLVVVCTFFIGEKEIETDYSNN